MAEIAVASSVWLYVALLLCWHCRVVCLHVHFPTLLCACVLSRVWLFVTPWTVARQASLSMGFSRQEYWSRLPAPSSRGSSRPRHQTRISGVSCIGRRILYHWVTWEGLSPCFFSSEKFVSFKHVLFLNPPLSTYLLDTRCLILLNWWLETSICSCHVSTFSNVSYGLSSYRVCFQPCYFLCKI